MSKETNIPLEFEGESLESVFVGRRDGEKRPTVILIPTVMGVSDLELKFGRQLVELGFNAFVADLFGKKFRGAPRDVCFGEMNRLGSDREALRRRLLAVVEQARGLGEVDAGKVVVAGYCFGGKCALDVARTGIDVAGAVSFHGLFDPPGWEVGKIKAKVLVLHGWDDPMAKPESVVALGNELTRAGADWQIHAYGHVGHGFTNPHASSLQIDGVFYHELAAERSWTALINFLEEVLG
jgi:dienelactone hydrolase